MSSLKANFQAVMDRVKAGREFGHASFELIFYLVFPPSEILEAKRQLPAFISKLRIDGWSLRFSQWQLKYRKFLKKFPIRFGSYGLLLTPRLLSNGRGPIKLWLMLLRKELCYRDWRVV